MGGKHFIFDSSRDGSNNIYEYIEPWSHVWRKPYAVRLTPEQPK